MSRGLSKLNIKEIITGAIIIIGAIALHVGVSYALANAVSGSYSMFNVMLYVLHKNSLLPELVLFLVVIILLWISLSSRKKEEAGRIGRSARIWLPFAIVVMAVVLILYNSRSLDKEFDGCKIKGEEPSRHAYHMALIKDALSGETELVEEYITELSASGSVYTYTSSNRHGVSHTYSDVAWMVAYTNAEGSRNVVSFVDGTAVEYIENLKALGTRMLVKIEYYPNSGTIKAINGYSPYDAEGLAASYAEYSHPDIG